MSTVLACLRWATWRGYNPAVQDTRKRSAAAAACAVVVLACSGCGGNSGANPAKQTTGEVSRPLRAEDRIVERKLVTQQEVNGTRPNSVKRAFLEYWSALGYEEWSVAVEFLSRQIRRALEPQYMASALEIESQNSLPVKPLVRGVRTTRGETTVRYLVRTSAGRLRATSMAWMRRKGLWYVAYSPTLAESYGSAVQQAVQSDIDPVARQPSKRALSAGARAARALGPALAPATDRGGTQKAQ
jgi:hypothetical protein